MTNLIVKKMQKLINKIKYYDYMYYIESKSIISDIDYDFLKNELEHLENEHPSLIQKNSPTYTVGFNPSFNLEKKNHEIPMLSLRNTYVLDDIIKFLNKENLWPVIMEPKIDGISLSLTYIDGYLQQALLRGNGLEGEDIFDHILYTNIIKKIDHLNKVEIRGELYITNENFQKINLDKKNKYEVLFQNSRNACGSIIRNKQKSYEELLNFIPYSFKENNQNYFDTQGKILDYLSHLGFEKQIYCICKNSEELLSNLNQFYNLPFVTDGIVIKTNSVELMDNLGLTNHHPKGAIAYKFTNFHKESTIINILWQVSRNGKILPVGEIIPIKLDGALIKKITLHNKNYMKLNNLYIGSIILIERVGSTVPQIKKIIKPINQKEILINQDEIFIKKNIPDKCPSCGNSLEEDPVFYYCNNLNCLEQIKEKIYYFLQALNLKGLGVKTIEELVKLYQTPSKIIELIIKKTLLKLHGWEKFSFYSIDILKKVNHYSLLTALGIENISTKNLKFLFEYLDINNLNDLIQFLQNDYEFILNNLLTEKNNSIKYVGKEKLKSFLHFTKNNSEEIIKIIQLIQSID